MNGSQQAQARAESLPSQLKDLSEDTVKLLEEHARLFQVEMQEELSAYLRDGLILGLGGLVGAVGFALFSSRLPKGTGIVYMLLGGATVLAMTNRLAQRSPIPQRTAAEIKEDRRWLRELA